ncbi:MAG: hypothetical protein JWN76_2480 [Chitinophagaceae bacterium]|nr:hypothetical protein [Chitinophagaceae bacterium]
MLIILSLCFCNGKGEIFMIVAIIKMKYSKKKPADILSCLSLDMICSILFISITAFFWVCLSIKEIISNIFIEFKVIAAEYFGTHLLPSTRLQCNVSLEKKITFNK